MTDLTQTITAIGALDLEAAKIVAVLDAHMREEVDHAKRGALHRLRSALTDFHFNLQAARVQFQASAKHAAAQGLHEVGDQLREVIADCPAGPNRDTLDSAIGTVRKAKAVVGKM
jgi:hypothetical protein